MSLKDRLSTVQQQKQSTQNTQTKEQQVQYYSSEVEANIDTLGALDTILADEEINNIFVSGAKNIYLEKKGKIFKSTTTFRDNVQLENMLKKIALNEGFELDEFHPYFEFNHKLGINVSTTVPPLSNVPTIFVKCYKDKHANLQTLQEELSISKEIALILEALCTIKKNILIIGEKNTLKTTLLSALAKKITSNNRAIIIDSENELKIIGQNFTNFDISKAVDKQTKETLLASIINTSPDKLIVNSDKDDIIAKTIEKMQNNYKGAVLNFCASNPQEAVEKLAYLFVKNNPYYSFEKARAIILGTFDIIITTKKDDIGRRKVSSISQINLLSKSYIEDIFTLDYVQHKSTGIIPIFFEDIKTNSLPIGDNIFDISYKHTYHKGVNLESTALLDKKANVDILKKFKKELPTQKTKEELENEVEEIFKERTKEELMKKAQEKFEELRKTVHIQDKTENEPELTLEDIPEEITYEIKDETV